MTCPECSTLLDVDDTGRVSCPDCGREWKTCLYVLGEKNAKYIRAAIASTTDTELIEQLTALDAAYGEAVDALTNGSKIWTH